MIIEWQHITITTDEQLQSMIKQFHSDSVVAAAFDTETTGLNHMRDKPFLFQFGWYTQEFKGYTYAVDLEYYPELAYRTITIWHVLVNTAPIYLGHNIKYDLHMCLNIGLPYTGENISDTQIYIRLSSNNVPERKGGVPMALKKFATQYIDGSARTHEDELKHERTSIAQQYNKQLQEMLNKSGKPPEAWGYKSWTKGCLNKFFSDKVNDASDLPEEAAEAWREWHTSLPQYLQEKVTGYVESDDIRYDKLNRETVTLYGHKDIVWTLEVHAKCAPVLKAREQEQALSLENASIYPLLEMERVGFKIDVDYVLASRDRTKEYILQRRQDLAMLAGQELKVGQQEAIKQILANEYNIHVDSTGTDALDSIVADLKHTGENDMAVDFISTIQELRSLEKWYATYIKRFIYNLKFGDTLYTTIHQVGTASGRVTSDFQQFPKGGLTTLEGEELFSPRRMVIAQDGDYIGIVYLDYSQIELRLQAMYTILVGHPDTNLCRAYMPYKCHTGDISFDYKNITHIQHAYDRDWYYDEAPDKHWEPLDVHGATTKAAFDITEDDPSYKSLRSVGKRVNFAKNYGAQYGKIKTMFPEYDDEQVKKIDSAYYTAFPGVKAYHDYCYKIAMIQDYVPNCFGVKYYGVSGHNLINMLVQGTGAYYLKWKVIAVHNYLKEKGCKSKFMMQIHDELQFKWHKDDDPEIFFEIQKLMEEWDDTLVPIVADMELSTTNWQTTREIERKEEFYE